MFRVYFWKALGSGAYESDEFEVRDADVSEALAWAEKERADRTFTLYLDGMSQQGLGSSSLRGSDSRSDDGALSADLGQHRKNDFDGQETPAWDFKAFLGTRSPVPSSPLTRC